VTLGQITKYRAKHKPTGTSYSLLSVLITPVSRYITTGLVIACNFCLWLISYHKLNVEWGRKFSNRYCQCWSNAAVRTWTLMLSKLFSKKLTIRYFRYPQRKRFKICRWLSTAVRKFSCLRHRRTCGCEQLLHKLSYSLPKSKLVLGLVAFLLAPTAVFPKLLCSRTPFVFEK
jgi:hypothetical protein